MPTTPIAKTEPVISSATIVTLASALVALLMAFWPDLLDEAQKTAVLGFVAVAAPIVLAILVRPKVTANSAVAEKVEGNTVIAGAANDRVAEGQAVRSLD